MSGSPPRVAAYGYFGMGNLGNEASLDAFVRYMRETHPEIPLRCFAAGADAVEREYGIPATQLMAYRADPHDRSPLAKLAKILSRLWDVPRNVAMMGDVDVLVVSGTGAMETSLVARPLGLPYWLFLGTASCRLRGGKVALVSVGVERATHPVIRWLYRWTGRLSTSRSYRDEQSRAAMAAMGVKGRPGAVVPDLAFALPTPEGGSTRPGHVVIGVMPFLGSPDSPRRGEAVLDTYVARMTELITRLVDKGRTVTLVVGDVADHRFAVGIKALADSARPDLAPGRVSVSEADTLEGVMEEMVEAEVVVASRFHNVVCALKLCRPTISLGYGEKNAHLLAAFGLGEYAHAMDSWDVDVLMEQVDEVRRMHPSVEVFMKETLERFENELGAQFHELSSTLLAPQPPPRAPSAPAGHRRSRR